MIRDKDYKEIASDVYRVDKRKYSRYLEENNITKNNYKILNVEDNGTNGMQAMAVAPVTEDGKVETSRIVIAYAGTNFGDSNDRNTDLQNVIMGIKGPLITNYVFKILQTPKANLNQIETAVNFAKQVRERYPDAYIDTTGHSLGGD